VAAISRLRSCSALLVSAFALACAHATAPAGTKLVFVAGHPVGESPAGCSPVAAEAFGPWEDPVEFCLDESTAIAVPASEIIGFRIEDRFVNDETWFLVSVYLTRDLGRRLRDAMYPLDSPISDGPYAALLDGEVLLASGSRSAFEDWPYYPLLLSRTRDLAQAGELANAWGRPVERVLAGEIAAQHLYPVTLVELIANRAGWLGQRVAVQGFLASSPGTWRGERVMPALYFSREHAEVDDWSSIPLVGGAELAEALSQCAGGWVVVEGFADRAPDLPIAIQRIERIASIPEGPLCWPRPDR
jgi:hypothetical protein